MQKQGRACEMQKCREACDKRRCQKMTRAPDDSANVGLVHIFCNSFFNSEHYGLECPETKNRKVEYVIKQSMVHEEVRGSQHRAQLEDTTHVHEENCVG